MSFDPGHVGFAWPEEIELTNALGEKMTVRPYAANFTGIHNADGKRAEECFRYYTSSKGILSELEVGHWLAGGVEECSRLCSMLKQSLEQLPEPAKLASVVKSLRDAGFADATIAVNLRWLIQDGYVSAQVVDGEWSIGNPAP